MTVIDDVAVLEAYKRSTTDEYKMTDFNSQTEQVATDDDAK